MTTVRDLRQQLLAMLTPCVGEGEAQSMVRIMLEHRLGITPVDVAVNPDRALEDLTVEAFRQIAQRVVDGEPLQYVLGVAQFMGRDFSVNPSTLIPRPETAMLVDMVSDDFAGRSDVHILDIGTGSGCIAITLALTLRFAHVDAIDISDSALETAKQNASRLRANVKFFNADALHLRPERHITYDAIVSNPPYICRSEAKDMDARVLRHEPDSALFVPDDDPLLFYRAIARYGIESLTPGGRLYFEINPLQSHELCELLENIGYDEVTAIRDYRGLYRYTTCTKPSE